MDHRTIEAGDVLERYVQGRLGEAEASAFEAHLLDCEECFEQVRWADDMGHALRVAAVEDVARVATGVGLLAWLARTARGHAVATLLALTAVVLPSSLYLRENARLRALVAPQVNTPVFALGATRDGATSRVSLGVSPEWIVLTLALPEVEHPSYRALLTNAAGEVVWHGDGLVPDAADRLVVSFYSTLLEPGHYNLSVTGPGQDVTPQSATFSFQVVR